MLKYYIFSALLRLITVYSELESLALVKHPRDLLMGNELTWRFRPNRRTVI